MPQLTLWDSFTKRANSTKRPSSAGWTVNAALKQATSLSSPTFILAAIPPIASAVNYAQFEGRFYFVTDIVQQSNHAYELHCTIDPLATYKDAIAAYTTFVERSASDFDTRINDNALSQRQVITHSDKASQSIYSLDGTGGYFIRVISGDGIIGYWMTAEQFAALVAFMFDDTNFTWADISDSLTKTFFNPFQYVVSCKWFPYNRTPTVASQLTDIKFGWWTATGVQGRRCWVSSSAQEVGWKLNYNALNPNMLTFPAKTYADFRAYNHDFTEYHVYLPGVGLVSMDPLEVADGDVQFGMYTDAYTGQVKYIIGHTSGAEICELSGQLGVDVQLGQLKGADIVSTGMNVIGAAAQMATGNVLGGVNSFINVEKNILSPTPSTIGAPGGMLELLNRYEISTFITEYGSAAFPQSVAGRPLYQNRQLGTLSGYVKCGNASIDISGFSGERDAVNAALNNGFYME